MSLSSAQNSALSALNVGSNRLQLIADNIAHAEDPNYSRKISRPIDHTYQNLAKRVGEGAVERQLDKNLQKLVLDLSGSTVSSQVKERYAERIQTVYGVPGDEQNLNESYNQFDANLKALATSPESGTLRSETLLSAQHITTELQKGAETLFSMFRAVEQDISTTVTKLNSALAGMSEANIAVKQTAEGSAERAAALDHRDNLIQDIANILPVKRIDQNGGGISLITKTGINLVEAEPVYFEYTPREVNQAAALFETLSTPTSESPLSIRDASGHYNLSAEHVLGEGELGALFHVRDMALPRSLARLDDMAHSLATVFNHHETSGTAVSVSGGDGFDLDTSAMVSGNRINIAYNENGVKQTLTIIQVGDAASLPVNDEVLTGPNKVIGVDFSQGLADVATDLNAHFGGALVFSDQGSSLLRVLDDGTSNTSTIETATVKTTVDQTSSGQLGFPLFVDTNNEAYTDNRDGIPQRLGFSSRIAVNQAVTSNPESLIIYQDSGSNQTMAGDNSRPQAMLDRLASVTLELSATSELASEHSGQTASMSAIFTSALNKTSHETEIAQLHAQSQTAQFETFSNRFNESRTVNMDEELNMLTQLEQYYAINARVLSVIREMFNLMLGQSS